MSQPGVGRSRGQSSSETATSPPGATAHQHPLLDGMAWPVVGRDAELDLIRRTFADDGVCSGMTLTGPAGVGKTRVARAAVAELLANGFAIEWIVGSEATSDVPLGTFAHLLPLPEYGIPIDLLDLLRIASAEISRRAAAQPLVLAIDDADLLDDASATVLRQLVTGSVVAVLLTTRAGRSAPDALSGLWRDGYAPRVEIPPLRIEDVHLLMTTALGGEVEHATLHRLWQTTQGNPLFVREAVISGVESGALRETDGVWRWNGAIGSGKRLLEMVEDRLARLDPHHRRELEVLAFGEPLGIAQFEALAGIEIVDKLERHELLTVYRDGQRQLVRLAHPLYSEVLRAGTPPLRARAIQRELAVAAELAPRRRREDFLTLARWQLGAGTAEDPTVLVQAATHAAGSFDFELAEKYAQAAIAAGAGLVASDLVAQGLRGQGRCQEADAVWSEMTAMTSDDAERSAIATARALNMFFGLGAGEEAEVVLLEAEARAVEEHSRHLLRANRGLLALHGGKTSEALETVRPLLDADDVNDRNRIDAATATATALALSGQTQEALELTDRTLPLAAAQPATGLIDAGVLLAVRFLALSNAGRFVDAHDELRAGYDFSVNAQQHEGMAVLGLAVGRASLALGDVSDAVRRLREAAALLRERDRNGFLPWCLGTLAEALVCAGDRDGAQLAVTEADVARRPGLRLFESEIERARAWVAVAHDDRATAADLLHDTAAWAISVGQTAAACSALHDLVRLGRPEEARGLLTDLASGSDSPLLRLYAEHAAAAADGDPERLQAVATAFADMQALLLAAETHAHASVEWRRADRAGRAASAAASAQELLRRCPGARPPAMASLDGSLPLTPREQEVAMLAAQGHTSRQIAAALFVSVRTVDNHLHRSYDKLGVRNRAELKDLLGPE